MKFIKNLIHSNIFISIAAVVFMLANAVLMQIELNKLIILSIHIFFSTWLVYQWSRKMYHEQMQENEVVDEIYFFQLHHKKTTDYIIYFSFIISLITFLFLHNQTKLAIIFVGAISILYALPLQKIGISFRLRDVPFLKIFLIAFSWSATATFIPALEAKNLFVLFDNYSWKFFAAQFLFILFITLPFDMSDMKNDKVQNLKTIPLLFGMKTSKVFLTIFFIAYVSIVFFLNINSYYIIGITLLCFVLLLISIFYIDKLTKTEVMLVYDGSMILYFFIVLFIKYIV